MNKKDRYFLYIFVFVCGTAVMFLEMAASRMMAPYFGSSIFVWGNIIGIVLIALSAGYYIGGRLADKYPQKDMLMFFVICAGVYASFIPVIFKALNDKLNFSQYFGSDFFLIVIIGSFFSSIIFFALPILILGFVSPYAIRLAANDIKDTGRVAGSLYAFSTMGSIIGTFGAAFIIVPFWGSRETVYLAAFLLLLASAIGLRKKPYIFFIVLLPIALYFLQAGSSIKESEEIIFEDDSMYQYIQISEKEGIRKLSVNDGLGTQSVYDPDSLITGKYYDYLSLAPSQTVSSAKKGLIIGLAGGTLSRQLNNFYPEMEITGVEIDPGVTKAATEHLGLSGQKVNIVTADGRMYLKYSGQEKFDVIFIDAYSHQLYVPWHLTTREFFQEVAGHLNAGGVVAMNVLSSSQENFLVKGIGSGLNSIFENVYITTLENGTSNIILASSEEINLDKLEELNIPELSDPAKYMAENISRMDKTAENDIFTDNRAPVELLSDKMWLKEIF